MKNLFAIATASLCLSSFALAENKQVNELKPAKLNPACLELAEKFIAAQETIEDSVGITHISEYEAVISAGDTDWAFTFAAPSWWHNKECRIKSVSVQYY